METVALPLSITNLLLHDIEAPNITNCDSLGTNVTDFKESDKVDVIGMNPPYGGSTEDSVKATSQYSTVQVKLRICLSPLSCIASKLVDGAV